MYMLAIATSISASSRFITSPGAAIMFEDTVDRDYANSCGGRCPRSGKLLPCPRMSKSTYVALHVRHGEIAKLKALPAFQSTASMSCPREKQSHDIDTLVLEDDKAQVFFEIICAELVQPSTRKGIKFDRTFVA